MTVKTVPVTLPDWMWGRLVSIADERRVPVAGLVADSLRKILDENPRIKKPIALEPLERLEEEVVAARKSGLRAPGIHTHHPKGKVA